MSHMLPFQHFWMFVSANRSTPLSSSQFQSWRLGHISQLSLWMIPMCLFYIKKKIQTGFILIFFSPSVLLFICNITNNIFIQNYNHAVYEDYAIRHQILFSNSLWKMKQGLQKTTKENILCPTASKTCKQVWIQKISLCCFLSITSSLKIDILDE